MQQSKLIISVGVGLLIFNKLPTYLSEPSPLVKYVLGFTSFLGLTYGVIVVMNWHDIVNTVLRKAGKKPNILNSNQQNNEEIALLRQGLEIHLECYLNTHQDLTEQIERSLPGDPFLATTETPLTKAREGRAKAREQLTGRIVECFEQFDQLVIQSKAGYEQDCTQAIIAIREHIEALKLCDQSTINDLSALSQEMVEKHSKDAAVSARNVGFFAKEQPRNGGKMQHTFGLGVNNGGN